MDESRRQIEFELFLGRYVWGVVRAISKDGIGPKAVVEYSANGDCATVRPHHLRRKPKPFVPPPPTEEENMEF